MEKFNIRLKQAMQEQNINAATLSKKTGIKPPMISDYLKGKYKAKQDKVYLISKVLNVNEAWLMGFDVDPERVPDKDRLYNDKILLDKIKSLSLNQKKEIINIIDNMKNKNDK